MAGGPLMPTGNPVVDFFAVVGTAIINFIKKKPVTALFRVITGVSAYKSYQAQKSLKNKGPELLLTKYGTGGGMPVLYGVRRVGGTVVFMDTAEEQRELFVVYAFCSGESESIADLRIDNRSITDRSVYRDGYLLKSDKASNLYGSGATHGTPGAEIANILGSAGGVDNPRMVFNLHHGADDQTADPMLTGIFNGTNADTVWTSNHRLRGITYIASNYEFDNNGMFQGIPNLTATIKGRKIYDPRLDSTQTGGSGSHRSNDSSTWEWSSNPALCLLDYLTNDDYGKGLAYSEIDIASFMDSADDCDEDIETVDHGSSVVINEADTTYDEVIVDSLSIYNSVKIGQSISFSSGGTTYFSGRVIAKYNPRIREDGDSYASDVYVLRLEDGSVTTAITTPTTGTLTETQKRFECNAVIDTNETVLENAQDLIRNMRGIFTYTNGKYSLKVEGTETPVLTLDEDDILDAGLELTVSNKETKFNRVEVEFYNAQKNYQADTVVFDHTPDVPNEDDHTYDDGGENLETRVIFPFVTNQRIAYNHAKAILKRSRAQKTISFVATPKVLKAKVGDVVSVTNSNLNLSAEQYRITQMQIQPDLNIAVTAVEYQGDVYGWSSAPDEDINLPRGEVDPYRVEKPTGLNFTNKSGITSAYLSWTDANTYPAYQYRVKVFDDINQGGDVIREAIVQETKFDLPEIPKGTGYSASVTAINTTNNESEAEVLNTFDVTVDTVVNEDIADSAVDTDEINQGAIGGMSFTATKAYYGTGTFNNSNTPFYVDTSSNFSLGSALSFNGTTLTIGGYATDTDIADFITGAEVNENVTSISGGVITTGTIDASVVSVTNLTADNITAGSLDVDRLSIDGTTITTSGGNLIVGTIDQDNISVSNLSSISADLGTITSGSISIDTSASIKKFQASTSLVKIGSGIDEPQLRVGTGGQSNALSFVTNSGEDGKQVRFSLDDNGTITTKASISCDTGDATFTDLFFTDELKSNNFTIVSSARQLQNIASLDSTTTTTIQNAVSAGSGTTINNNADNRIITGSNTADTLNGEANLTFDGSTLGVTGSITASGDITANSGYIYIAGSSASEGGELSLNRGTSGSSDIKLDNYQDDFRVHADGSVRFQHNGSDGLDVKTGGYLVNGTTVIDSTRNLTNIGSITGTGISTGANLVSLFNNQNGTNELRLSNNRQDLGNVPVSKVSGMNSSEIGNMTFYRGNGGASGYIIFQSKPTNASSLTDVFQIGNESTVGYGVDVLSGGLRIGGTEIVTSAGNLTNVGSISSGAITSTGQLELQASTPSIHFLDTDDNSDGYIQANAGTLRFYADDNNEVGSSIITFNIDGGEKARIDNGGNISLREASETGANSIHLPRAGGITFYGNASNNHGIFSRNSAGVEDDDIRINTYGNLFINLDANNNNSSSADFVIGRHAGGTGAISDAGFMVDGETFEAKANGFAPYSSTSTIAYKGYGGRDAIGSVDGATYIHGSDSAGYGLVVQSAVPVAKQLDIGLVNAGVTVITSARNIQNVGSITATGNIQTNGTTHRFGQTATGANSITLTKGTTSASFFEIEDTFKINATSGETAELIYNTTDESDVLKFINYNADVLTLDASNNATFTGTISSGAITVTADAGNEQLVIKRSSNNNEQLILGFHSSDYGTIQAVEQGVSYRNLYLQPSGANVGIGAASAAYTLDVNGSFAFRSTGYAYDTNLYAYNSSSGKYLRFGNDTATGGILSMLDATDLTIQGQGNGKTIFGGEITGTNSYAEFGNGYASASNDGGWHGRLNVAGTSHARIDAYNVSDGIKTTMYAHTGHGAGRIGTISSHHLDFITAGGVKARLDNTNGNFLVGDGTLSATYSASGRGLIEIIGINEGLLAFKGGTTVRGYIHGYSGGMDILSAGYLQFFASNGYAGNFVKTNNDVSFQVGQTAFGSNSINLTKSTSGTSYFAIADTFKINATSGETTELIYNLSDESDVLKFISYDQEVLNMASDGDVTIGSGRVDVGIGSATSTWTASGRACLNLNGSSTSLLGFTNGSTNRGYIYTAGSTMEFLSYGNVQLSAAASSSYVAVLGTNGFTTTGPLRPKNGKARLHFHDEIRQGSGSIHLKTSIPWAGHTQMYSVAFTGHEYGAAKPVDATICWYSYSPSGQPINIGSAGTHTITLYQSSDGYLVMRLALTSGYYTGFTLSQYLTAQGLAEFSISATSQSTAATVY